MASLLIVEDDAHLGGVLAASLGGRPGEFDVFTAANVEEAMRWLAVHAFDILLLDLFLPDGDGVDLARSARTLNANVQVVMMTGSPRTADLKRAREAGVTLFLKKPFDIENLRATLMALSAGPPSCAHGRA